MKKSLPSEYLPTENESRQANPWLESIEDAANTMLETLPPVVEVIEGIVASESKLIIGAGSKSYKTWLSITFCLSVAHGVPVLNLKTTRHRVLFVNLELKSATFKRRIQTIAKAAGISVEPDWFYHISIRGKIARLSLETIVNHIIELATKHKCGVVCLDPVYKLNQGDENSSLEQTKLFNELDRIVTEAKCTLILNDHFGKGNQSEKDPLDAIRGSSAKGGDIDAAMVLRRHDVEDCFRVDIVHRELAPVRPFCIGWKFPLFELRPDLDPDKMKKLRGGRPKGHDPATLLAHIKDTSTESPISISEWGKRANVQRNTLAGYLRDFHRQGLITTVGEGRKARQCITRKGLEFLEKEENKP